MDAPGPVRWLSRGRRVPRTGTRARSSPAGSTVAPTGTGKESVSSRKDRHDRVYRPALGAAPVERAAHCHRVSLHGARRAEAARLSHADDQPAGAVLADRPGTLELVGGALLLVGVFTRPVAFILSGEMAFAYFMAHAPQNFWPIINRGELAVMYCFVFLFLSA